MLKTVLYLLVIFGPSCASENSNQASTAGGSDINLLNLLSGNGIYNPMDPMGFIFRGNSEQYRGNGIDTPRYNPDKFAYAYAGAAIGPGVNPFIPNFINSESINKSPNYAQHLVPTKPPHTDSNETNMSEKNKTKSDSEPFSRLPVAAGSPSKAAVPEYVSQTFPENIMSVLSRNASSMFPKASFSGQPGMLGVGEQTPLQAVIPARNPVPRPQFLSEAVKNVSETRVLSPVYAGFPGMVGNKQQHILAANALDTSTPKPLYSGYPGMLGVGQVQNSMDSHVYGPVESRQDGSSRGYSNTDRSGYRTSDVNPAGNNYISAVPGVNTNNWKGEWPGKSAAGGDWTGDWADKWPKGNSDAKEGGKSEAALQFGNSASQPSSHTDWDGSWPGSDDGGEQSKKPSNDFGSLGETMAALEKLMGMLNNVPASVDDQSSPRSASPTFREMVSSWKEDMKP